MKLCDRSMLVVDALHYHRDLTDQAGLLTSPVGPKAKIATASSASAIETRSDIAKTRQNRRR